MKNTVSQRESWKRLAIQTTRRNARGEKRDLAQAVTYFSDNLESAEKQLVLFDKELNELRDELAQRSEEVVQIRVECNRLKARLTNLTDEQKARRVSRTQVQTQSPREGF